MEERKTNADLIRSMNDGELAVFLCNLTSLDGCNILCPGYPFCEYGHTGMVDWVKMKAPDGMSFYLEEENGQDQL